MTTEFTWQHLPPVGLRCEVQLDNEKEYTECEIIAHYDPCEDGEKVAVFAYKTTGGRRVDQRIGPCFRAIKTPQQLAVEQPREKTVESMRNIILNTVKYASGEDAKNYAEVLFDAGYRKFEIVEDDV